MQENQTSPNLTPENARDMMNSPKVISKDSKFSDLTKKLFSLNLSRLVVEDNGKHVGIITTKDWAFYLFKNKNKDQFLDIPITEIMHDIEYVDETTPISKCASIMLAKRVSSLAVGSGDHVDGIFTKTDLVKYYALHLPMGHRKVDDYKTSNYIWVSDNENTLSVLQKMVENNISRIIVKNSDGATAGIVTLGDFMRPFNYIRSQKTSENEPEKNNNQVDRTLEMGPTSGLVLDNRIKVTEIMSKDLFTVQKNEDLKIACKTFLDYHIDGVGVVERNTTLCGILSKTDITRAVSSMN